MMSLLAMLALAAVNPTLERALSQSLTRPGGKVELLHWAAPACNGLFSPAPFDRSGKVAVRVRGPLCDAWGWAHVRVLTPSAVLTRDIKTDEPIAGAWQTMMVEAHGDTLSTIPNEATATRTLRRGMAVEPSQIRVGPKPGTAVTVRVLLGGLSIEQKGTISSCAPQAVCAALPSGKKVAGVWSDGVLTVGGGS